MKIVRIDRAKQRVIVKDHGDMEVQKRNGECTSVSSFFPAFTLDLEQSACCCSNRSLSSSVDIRLMSRRQFADWLEELYNDILELIVSTVPLPLLIVSPALRNAFGEAECQEANCLYEDTFEACMQGRSFHPQRRYRLTV